GRRRADRRPADDRADLGAPAERDHGERRDETAGHRGSPRPAEDGGPEQTATVDGEREPPRGAGTAQADRAEPGRDTEQRAEQRQPRARPGDVTGPRGERTTEAGNRSLA